jgi:hypothetical protein
LRTPTESLATNVTTTKQTLVSPDGALVLRVEAAEDGTEVLGFEGGDWHTHPDQLACWFGVPERDAVQFFLAELTNDRLPIVLSIDQGKTIDPWVSDNLRATLDAYGRHNCVLRTWSGLPLRTMNEA